MNRQHAAAEVFEKRQHQLGRIAPRIAARKEDSGHGTIPEKLLALVEQFRAFGRLLEVELRRKPEPVVQAIAMADLADGFVHLAPPHLHNGSRTGVLKRDAFDAVDAE